MAEGAPMLRLPQVFSEAEADAAAGQSRYLRATRVRLVLAVLAGLLVGLAPLAEESEANPWALASALCFAGAFVVEVWLHRAAPQQLWYQGRALAESCKTLGWRYSVGGLPFALDVADPDSLFADRVRQLLEDDTDANRARRKEWHGRTIAPTDSMRDLRQTSLATRRKAFLAGRLDDQCAWYESRSTWNDRMAGRWRVLLLGLEAVGVALALATGMGWLHIDLASAISAALGCVVAWVAVRQHDALATTYAGAATELALAIGVVRGTDDEASWTRAVADAEDAISREHTMWRAQRRGHHKQR